MPLPDNVVARMFQERDLIGLLFNGGGSNPRMYILRVLSSEVPNNLYEFSLGSASALNTTGTGWQTIEDTNGNEYLEPDHESILHQVFYGVSPTSAWVYRRYPPDVDRGSLIGTRTIGEREGFVDGKLSPLNYPSPLTETVVVKGTHPSYLGYHPYAAPSSINVFMNFYVVTLGIEQVDAQSLSPEERSRVRRISVGGRALITKPGWLSEAESLHATVPGF